MIGFSTKAIEWDLTIDGRKIAYVFIQTVWHREGIDVAVENFILN